MKRERARHDSSPLTLEHTARALHNILALTKRKAHCSAATLSFGALLGAVAVGRPRRAAARDRPGRALGGLDAVGHAAAARPRSTLRTRQLREEDADVDGHVRVDDARCSGTGADPVTGARREGRA